MGTAKSLLAIGIEATFALPEFTSIDCLRVEISGAYTKDPPQFLMAKV
jgi:hypothetical protein